MSVGDSRTGVAGRDAVVARRSTVVADSRPYRTSDSHREVSA